MLLRMLSQASEADCLHHLPQFTEKDINARSADGATALHFAASAGYADVCLELLESPLFMQVNDQDASGCTALHYAACKGHREVCQALLQHWRFSAQDTQDWNGWTALHVAAAHGQRSTCSTLLESPRFKVLTARDKNGMTAPLGSITLSWQRACSRVFLACAVLSPGCMSPQLVGVPTCVLRFPTIMHLPVLLLWTTSEELSMLCDRNRRSRTEVCRQFRFRNALQNGRHLPRPSHRWKSGKVWQSGLRTYKRYRTRCMIVLTCFLSRASNIKQC